MLATVGVLGALLTLATPAPAGNGGIAPVSPESPNAEAITQSYWFITIFVIAILALVEGLLVVFLVRYRRRKRARTADGAQVHGSSRLETTWTIGPVLILFAIAAFVFVKLPTIQDVPTAAAGERNLVVEVVGQQFYWEFRYPNGVISIDRLRAPQGRTVELDVTAPDWDVIHSWWVPALGGKIDAIPGTVNRTWFRADKTGVYQGQCAELCGLYHAKMLDTAEVLPAAEFDRWLETQRSEQTAGTSSLGREQFEGVCAKCHGLSGEGGYGPKLAGNGLVDDPEALERLLRNGLGQMPPVGKDWTDEQMTAISDYLGKRFGNGG